MARTKDVLDDLAEWYALPAIDEGASSSWWYAALPELRLRSAVRRGLAGLGRRLLAWHDRARERRELMELTDDQLRDLGIARAEARRQAGRPFWRS